MKIFKYPLEYKEYQEVEIPSGAWLLSVQVQNEHLCLWALINEKEKEKRLHQIIMYRTGQSIKEFFTMKFLGLCNSNLGH